MKLVFGLLTCLCLAPTLTAQVNDQALMRSCLKQVSANFSQWRLAPVSRDVVEASERLHVNATTVWGDFDGDGRKDVALLVLDGPDPNPQTSGRLGSLHIAVCLNTSSAVKLYLINKPYCGDGITISRKGGRYYDFETDKSGTYRFDGVHAYCYEKAGATYQFESGSFRRIVDSD